MWRFQVGREGWIKIVVQLSVLLFMLLHHWNILIFTDLVLYFVFFLNQMFLANIITQYKICVVCAMHKGTWQSIGWNLSLLSPRKLKWLLRKFVGNVSGHLLWCRRWWEQETNLRTYEINWCCIVNLSWGVVKRTILLSSHTNLIPHINLVCDIVCFLN